MNYGLNEYANNVIWGIGDACNEHGLPHPTVITESGRAVTAHHTVLVSNVIGVERNEFSEPLPPEADAPRALESMWETWLEMNEPENRRSLREWLHSQMDLHDVHTQYAHGMLDLTKRAWAEQLYLNICNKIQQQRSEQPRAPPNHRRTARTHGGQVLRQLLAVPVDAGCLGYRPAVPGAAAGRAG